MGRTPYQFRYYGDNKKNNNPLDLTQEQLINKNIFDTKPFITQIGIQANPGTQFKLNQSINSWITIGETGIYELDLSGKGNITSIQFNKNAIFLDQNNPELKIPYIFIDIVYNSLDGGIKE